MGGTQVLHGQWRWGGWEGGRQKAGIHQLRGREPDSENDVCLLEKVKGSSLGLHGLPCMNACGRDQLLGAGTVGQRRASVGLGFAGWE